MDGKEQHSEEDGDTDGKGKHAKKRQDELTDNTQLPQVNSSEEENQFTYDWKY